MSQKIAAMVLCFLFFGPAKAEIDERGIYKTSVFDFYKVYPSPCEDRSVPCYTIKSMINKSMRVNYESRQAIEKIFQTRVTARKNLGTLAPHLNVGSGFTDFAAFNPVQNALDMTSAFVGFLFPNRWYSWKASRALAEAELESTKSLFADRTNIILANYFYVQQQIWQIRVHTHYVDELQKLLDVLHFQHDHGLRRIKPQDFAIIENIKGRQMYALAFINNLTATYPILAYSMGMDRAKDWTNFHVEPHAIVSTKDVPIGRPETYIDSATKNSTELSNVYELVKAARLNKKANYFDIFDPSSGNDFGYGYGQTIKIAKANVKILEIQIEKMKAQIIVNVNNYLNSYNDAVVALKTLEAVLPLLDDIRVSIEDNVNDYSQAFDILMAARYFETAYWAGLDYSGAYFMLRTNEVGLDRLTWHGPYYEQILRYMDTDFKSAYEQAKREHSFRHSFKRKWKHFWAKVFKKKVPARIQPEAGQVVPPGGVSPASPEGTSQAAESQDPRRALKLATHWAGITAKLADAVGARTPADVAEIVGIEPLSAPTAAPP